MKNLRLILLAMFCLPATIAIAEKKSSAKSINRKETHKKDRQPNIPTPSAKRRNQVINHRKAYKPRPGRGEHIDIKVTPPEKRGKKGHLLVEVYNNSKKYISVMKFHIKINSAGYKHLSSEILVEEMWPNWSDVKWIKIGGNGKLPKVYTIEIEKMELFDHEAKPLKIPFYSDLIKN